MDPYQNRVSSRSECHKVVSYEVLLYTRMLTGVHICTLHDLEMGSPNDGESVEIIDDSVGCTKTPGKALIKSLSLLFLQNKLPF